MFGGWRCCQQRSWSIWLGRRRLARVSCSCSTCSSTSDSTDGLSTSSLRDFSRRSSLTDVSPTHSTRSTRSRRAFGGIDHTTRLHSTNQNLSENDDSYRIEFVEICRNEKCSTSKMKGRGRISCWELDIKWCTFYITDASILLKWEDQLLLRNPDD